MFALILISSSFDGDIVRFFKIDERLEEDQYYAVSFAWFDIPSRLFRQIFLRAAENLLHNSKVVLRR